MSEVFGGGGGSVFPLSFPPGMNKFDPLLHSLVACPETTTPSLYVSNKQFILFHTVLCRKLKDRFF